MRKLTVWVCVFAMLSSIFAGSSQAEQASLPLFRTVNLRMVYAQQTQQTKVSDLYFTYGASGCTQQQFSGART